MPEVAGFWAHTEGEANGILSWIVCGVWTRRARVTGDPQVQASRGRKKECVPWNGKSLKRGRSDGCCEESWGPFEAM